MSSRAQIHCGHCGNGPMERRHLKGHTEHVHKGLKVFERAPTSQSVLNVVSTSNMKRVHSVEDKVEGAKIQRSDVFDDEELETMEELVVPEKGPETVHVAREVTNEDILVEIKEAKEQIINSVNRLQKSNFTIEPIYKDEVEQDGEDDFKQKLLKAKTKVEAANAHEDLEYNEEKDYIICQLCFDPKRDKELNAFKNKDSNIYMQVPGAIQVLNVKEPTSENEPQDRTFRNMKSKIVTHVQSQTHKEKEIEKKLNNDKKKGPEQKNKEEAAMRCARLSHELIKMGRPFTDYPELVTLFVKKWCLHG